MTGENVLLSCRIEAMAMFKFRPPACSAAAKNVARREACRVYSMPGTLFTFHSLRLDGNRFLIFDQESST